MLRVVHHLDLLALIGPDVAKPFSGGITCEGSTTQVLNDRFDVAQLFPRVLETNAVIAAVCTHTLDCVCLN